MAKSPNKCSIRSLKTPKKKSNNLRRMINNQSKWTKQPTLQAFTKAQFPITLRSLIPAWSSRPKL